MNARSMLSLAFIAAIVILGVFALQRYQFRSCPARSFGDDSIAVGTAPEFPPLEFIDDGKLVGFDIDLMEAVGQLIHKKIDWKEQSFDALIPAAQLGTIAVIASGISPTTQRQERLLFTKPYLSGSPFVIISFLHQPITHLDQLPGKKVAVALGHVADIYISALPHIEVVRLATVTDAFMALTNNQVDAYISGMESVKPFLKQFGKEKYTISKIPNTGEQTALAISKHHAELLPIIQEALDTLEKNGTIAQLKAKWGLGENND